MNQTHTNPAKHTGVRPDRASHVREEKVSTAPKNDGKTWNIMKRPLGSTANGEQAHPSTFSGTEDEAKAYVAAQTVATQQAGAGPAFEFFYEPG